MSDQKFESVIGLEVHAQLLTETKIFCGCSTRFGNDPNSNVCPVCLGHPGVLPVLNKKAVEFILKMGLATNCTINEHSVFARKNYFYPDLPKGYQISQYELPVCEHGHIDVEKSDGTTKRIGITRIHLEEDAGKSIHDQGMETLVDVNRCGVPLIEIVSEPDIRTAEEAYLYLTKIKQIVQYLGVCDGNMEEGSLRCDANISIRPLGQEAFGTKTEVKNMNSFRNVERAINAEIERQTDIVNEGGTITQQTLLWNADTAEVKPMRSKEEAHDYRYFPDPDLMPVNVNEEWRSEIARDIPELPDARKARFVEQYSLPEYDAVILTQTRGLADYFEKAAGIAGDHKGVSNWVMGDVLKVLNETKIEIEDFAVSAEHLGELVSLIKQGTISGKIAKDVYEILLKEKKSPKLIIEERNMVQVSDEGAIEPVVDEILANNEKQIQQYLDGKDKVLGFFVGQIMKATKGKANPGVVNKLLRDKLDALK